MEGDTEPEGSVRTESDDGRACKVLRTSTILSTRWSRRGFRTSGRAHSQKMSVLYLSRIPTQSVPVSLITSAAKNKRRRGRNVPLLSRRKDLALSPLSSLLLPQLTLARTFVPDPLEAAQDLSRVPPMPLCCHRRIHLV